MSWRFSEVGDGVEVRACGEGDAVAACGGCSYAVYTVVVRAVVKVDSMSAVS